MGSAECVRATAEPGLWLPAAGGSFPLAARLAVGSGLGHTTPVVVRGPVRRVPRRLEAVQNLPVRRALDALRRRAALCTVSSPSRRPSDRGVAPGHGSVGAPATRHATRTVRLVARRLVGHGVRTGRGSRSGRGRRDARTARGLAHHPATGPGDPEGGGGLARLCGRGLDLVDRAADPAHPVRRLDRGEHAVTREVRAGRRSAARLGRRALPEPAERVVGVEGTPAPSRAGSGRLSDGGGRGAGDPRSARRGVRRDPRALA